MNLSCVFYRMAPRPPTPPQPSSEMNQIARAIEMMVNAIQQQNVAMAQNHQAAMHHWENARSAATASHVSLSQEQMGLTEFMRHNPPKFSGNATPDQADQWIRELEKICLLYTSPSPRD